MSYLEAIEKSQILTLLKDHNPFVAGTLPLGIAIPDSDIDLICCAPDLEAFASLVHSHFGTAENYKSYVTDIRGIESQICQFKIHGFEFEVFAQNTPTEEQYAVLHFKVEKKLLELGGEEARQAIYDLKLQGIKTEPAFAEYFKIEGDPFDELAKLSRLNDEDLKAYFNSLQ